MFTGIVEEMGNVERIAQTGPGYSISYKAKVVLQGTKLGDSIAVNGTCLTVTRLSPTSFTVDVAPESLTRTNLGRLKQGDPVNLERAVTPATRLGGHMVQGHVDGLGSITALRTEADSIWVTVAAPPEILRYVVTKGFICLDGVSLTVVDVFPDRFTIMLVPHTQANCIQASKQVGYQMNIEVDIIGKYVEKFVSGPQQAATGVTQKMLQDNGYS